MKARKYQQRIDERRIDAAYRATCSGVQVDIMNIGKIFKAGQAAIDAGADDVALQSAIVAFVASAEGGD